MALNIRVVSVAYGLTPEQILRMEENGFLVTRIPRKRVLVELREEGKRVITPVWESTAQLLPPYGFRKWRRRLHYRCRLEPGLLFCAFNGNKLPVDTHAKRGVAAKTGNRKVLSIRYDGFGFLQIRVHRICRPRNVLTVQTDELFFGEASALPKVLERLSRVGGPIESLMATPEGQIPLYVGHHPRGFSYQRSRKK